MFDHRKVAYFDGAGHPIACRARMLRLYEGCPVSTGILRRYMPCQFVVSPGIKIAFVPRNPKSVTIEGWYPEGGWIQNKVLSDNALTSLRGLWKNPRGGWSGAVTFGVVVFTKRSFIRLLTIPGEPRPFEYEWVRGS